VNGKIKLLFLSLVLASVLLAGCSGGQPESGAGTAETTPTPTEAGGQEGSGNPYDTANEISPPPEAADVHETIKPILDSVFGGAKLTDYLSSQGPGGKGVSLVYVVKNTIDSGKAQELRDRIASAGYTSIYGGMESDSFGFQFVKDNKILIVGGDIGGNYITVVWGEGS